MSANEGVDEAPFHDRRKIRRRRIIAGRSQADVAREADITPAHLCNIEKGKANPSPEALARIAAVIGCKVTDLERDTDDCSAPTQTAVR